MLYTKFLTLDLLLIFIGHPATPIIVMGIGYLHRRQQTSALISYNSDVLRSYFCSLRLIVFTGQRNLSDLISKALPQTSLVHNFI